MIGEVLLPKLPFNPQYTLSIVIPTLNSPWLKQTVEGIRAQTYDLSKVEVIVVGQDDARQIVQDDLVKFVETDGPKPPAISRNIGLRLSTGEIVCFIDDDCVPDKDWLLELVCHYTEARVNVVGGGIAFPSHGYWAKCDALCSVYEYLTFRPAGSRKQLPSMNFSVRRDVLNKLGGFDENFPHASGEDAELCMRLRRLGNELYFTPTAIVYHLGWRKTRKTVWQHIYLYGQFSSWINPSVADVVSPPFFFKHWLLFVGVAPLLVVWISLRMFLRTPQLFKSWILFWGVCYAQFAWCLGIIRQLQR